MQRVVVVVVVVTETTVVVVVVLVPRSGVEFEGWKSNASTRSPSCVISSHSSCSRANCMRAPFLAPPSTGARVTLLLNELKGTGNCSSCGVCAGRWGGVSYMRMYSILYEIIICVC